MSVSILFNQKKISSIPTPSKEREIYQDTQCRYLYLLVTNSGKKTFYYVRRLNKKLKWIKLDTFPGMTVFIARKRCDEISGQIAEGHDPDSRQQKNMTVCTLFEQYLEFHSKPYKKSWREDQSKFQFHFGPIKDTPIERLSITEIVRWHSDIGTKRGEIIANRCLELLRTMINWGRMNGYYTKPENPASLVTKYPESSRTRFMEPEEVSRFLKNLNSISPDMQDFFMLCLVTGARRGNVQSMRWDQLDLESQNTKWKIPRDESKNKDEMTIALVPLAVKILKNRAKTKRSEYVFPAGRSDSKTPHLVEPKKSWKSLCERANLRDLHMHDLRRTLGSWQAKLGYSDLIIGSSLGQKDPKTTRIYARLNLDPVRASVSAAVEEFEKYRD